jgi:hypothetical protein
MGSFFGFPKMALKSKARQVNIDDVEGGKFLGLNVKFLRLSKTEN